MRKSWPMVTIGEVLRRSEETIELHSDTHYRQITVKLWGKGVVQRGVVTGAEVAASRQLVARHGQFILSRIDARNGAFGIVPDKLDGAIVSNDFPVYNLVADRLLPAYLGWMCQTAAFIEKCQRASEGSTNRVRLQEERFLVTEVDLPLLEEQRRIVARIDELAAQIQEAKAIGQEAAKQAEALVVSTHLRLAGARSRKLAELLALDEHSVEVITTGTYLQVGVRGFGGGLFPKTAVTGTETTYRSFNRLYDGALVLSQVKGWEGAVAMCGKDLSGWFVSPEYRTFSCIPGEARPRYIAGLIRTEWFWKQLANVTRGVGARRERTRPEQFLLLEMPMPDAKSQERGERIFAEVATLRATQRDVAAEVDALLPSILDRAFRGEL
jgi:type I restriction enzyme S subunit